MYISTLGKDVGVTGSMLLFLLLIHTPMIHEVLEYLVYVGIQSMMRNGKPFCAKRERER